MGYNLTYIDDRRLGVVIGETDDSMPCPSNYIGEQTKTYCMCTTCD